VRAILVFLFALAAGGCGAPPRSADPLYGRTAVALEPAERDLVLAEMRQFVTAIRGIIEGLGDNDMKALAASARAVGLGMHRAQLSGPSPLAARVAEKLPPEFRKLGLATYAAFDEMAAYAEQSGDRDQVLALLADNLRRCVACHSTYRLP
jgi:mono/diheme cytochrome c family protein